MNGLIVKTIKIYVYFYNIPKMKEYKHNSDIQSRTIKSANYQLNQLKRNKNNDSINFIDNRYKITDNVLLKRDKASLLSPLTVQQVRNTGNNPIQMWIPSYVTLSPDPGDDEIILSLINETGSWHGHTVLAAEGWEADRFGGGKRWLNVWSFMPKNESAGFLTQSFGGIGGGVKAKLIEKNFSAEETKEKYFLTGNKEIGWFTKVTRAQYNILKNTIDQEKSKIENEKVKYVGLGHPIGMIKGIFAGEYHDNCNSWANRVLRQSGIISSLWGLNYYLPSIPVLTSKLYKSKENQLLSPV